MRSGFRLLLALGFLLSLALPAAAAAQAPQPGGPPPRTAALGPDGLAASRPAGVEAASAPAAAGFTIGQPGLSFRHVQTYGTVRSSYISDTLHLNRPYSVAASGNAVWIAEAFGRRALKYSSSGPLLAQIGLPAIHDQSNDVSFGEIRGINVDASGNVWLADDGAGQVLEYGPDLKFVRRLGQQWQHGQANNQFAHPTSVAVDAVGRIYVSDGAPEWDSQAGNHRIQIFDGAGSYLGTLGQTGMPGSGSNQFTGPRHMAIYGSQLYVADSGNNRIQIFDVANFPPVYANTIQLAQGDPNRLANPSGVAVDGSFVYVADTGGQRVQIFNRATRAYVATIGSGQFGSAADQFKNPSDVAVDAAGNLYVADLWNERVQQFSPARALQRTFGTTGVPYLTDGNHFFEASGLAANADGSFYVVEEHGARLVRVGANGAAQWTIGEAGVGGGWDGRTDHLNNAKAVAADGSGRAYVADTWNHRILIYSPTGAYLATLGVAGHNGTDNGHFNAPQGVFVAANNWLYVADTDNQRVQIFDAGHNYVATLGITGVAGSDNGHFSSPDGVAVDGNGVIYVSDGDNQRVQVFGANRAYLRTIGETGVSRDDYGHFDAPGRLAVDSANNLYVADGWHNRVQVFDPNGAYLTTVGYPGGSGTNGQLHGAFAVAVDPAGEVYVASYWDPATIQKFLPGVPHWQQLNINGFGNQGTADIIALASFGGRLYAGSYAQGAALWRTDAGGAWSQVVSNGFGDPANQDIGSLVEFKGSLYAGTDNWVCPNPQCIGGHSNGAQIWRSPDGAQWDRVTLPPGFGAWNQNISAFAVFSDTLYAATSSGDATHGAEIWRSAGGSTWEQVAANGLDNDIYNTSVLSLAAYGGSLYAGTRHGDWYPDAHPNGPLGGEVWRFEGGAWTRVNDPGFGDPNQYRVESLTVFGNALYATISHVGASAGGAQVWRCSQAPCQGQSAWVKVADNGFGVPANQLAFAAAALHDRLYVATRNDQTGVQVWSTDGTTWSKALAVDGFGLGDNRLIWSGALIVHNNQLVAGVSRYNGGAGVWRLLNLGPSLYLPVLKR